MRFCLVLYIAVAAATLLVARAQWVRNLS